MSPTSEPRPRDDELDLFGITHTGLVREENQDSFLLCTVHPQVVVRATSLADVAPLTARGQRLATLMLVADGVGGSAAGGLASRLATEAVTRHLAAVLGRQTTDEGTRDRELLEGLRGAAQEAHALLHAEAARRPDGRGMATTLSLGVVMWPWLYVLHLGDSRCYVCINGALRQVTRDQTVAQDLVQQGVLTPELAARSPFSHMLSSALGAPEAVPEVVRVDVGVRGCVVLVCSDGLTKHVADDEIADHLTRMTSAEQVCRDLLQLALDRGGSDNVTIVVGRSLPLKPA